MRYIAIILVVVLMSSCRAGPPWKTWMYEGPPPGTLEKIPDRKIKDVYGMGNPSLKNLGGTKYQEILNSSMRELYRDGWIDGCESGVSATTNLWYKFQYKFKQDAYKAQNRVYYKGWKDAFDYCQRYIYQYERRYFM